MITTPLNKIKVFDIETVATPWDKLSEIQKSEWIRKHAESTPQEAYDAYKSEGALHAEYAQVCCFSMNCLEINSGERVAQSLCYKDELDILSQMPGYLIGNGTLAGHNIKGFDIPFLCKRYLINGMQVPSKLDFYGKKPWEIDVIDTMEIWKFSGWKGATSLTLLCDVLGVESPKGDMDGSKVGEAFYNGEYKRISQYCELDVNATFEVIKKLQ